MPRAAPPRSPSRSTALRSRSHCLARAAPPRGRQRRCPPEPTRSRGRAIDAAGNRTDGSTSFAVPDTTAPAFGTPEPAGRLDARRRRRAERLRGRDRRRAPASIRRPSTSSSTARPSSTSGGRATSCTASPGAAARRSAPPRAHGRRSRGECRAARLGRRSSSALRRTAAGAAPASAGATGPAGAPGANGSSASAAAAAVARKRAACRARVRRADRRHEAARGRSSGCTRGRTCASRCACAAVRPCARCACVRTPAASPTVRVACAGAATVRLAVAPGRVLVRIAARRLPLRLRVVPQRRSAPTVARVSGRLAELRGRDLDARGAHGHRLAPRRPGSRRRLRQLRHLVRDRARRPVRAARPRARPWPAPRARRSCSRCAEIERQLGLAAGGRAASVTAAAAWRGGPAPPGRATRPRRARRPRSRPRARGRRRSPGR